MRRPLAVDELSQYYQIESFNFGNMKAKDVDQVLHAIKAIFYLIVSPEITERWGEI